jgi:hypothetical protein
LTYPDTVRSFQRARKINAVNRIARKTVSLTISRMGLNPTGPKSFRCAFIPIADVETTSNQVENL